MNGTEGTMGRNTDTENIILAAFDDSSPALHGSVNRGLVLSLRQTTEITELPIETVARMIGRMVEDGRLFQRGTLNGIAMYSTDRPMSSRFTY